MCHAYRTLCATRVWSHHWLLHRASAKQVSMQRPKPKVNAKATPTAIGFGVVPHCASPHIVHHMNCERCTGYKEDPREVRRAEHFAERRTLMVLGGPQRHCAFSRLQAGAARQTSLTLFYRAAGYGSSGSMTTFMSLGTEPRAMAHDVLSCASRAGDLKEL